MYAKRMPPREAILACKGKAMQASCQFKDRNGISYGICNDKPGIMACAPNRGKLNFKPNQKQQEAILTKPAISPKVSINSSGSIKFKLEAWADNWFAAYLENTLIIEDSISIKIERSFNHETVVFDANYPLHINFILKDFKQNDTGLEYIKRRNQQMGDGGFIMQLSDMNSNKVVAVSNENMKCMVVHKAPLYKSCERELSPHAGTYPCTFTSLPKPQNWMSSDFDDSSWENATEYSTSDVRPKGGYDSINWIKNAKLIWSSDLETDNTILCRLTINNPEKNLELSSKNKKNVNYTTDTSSIFNYFNSKGVSVKHSSNYYHISSDGIPTGNLMVGIKSWQQQVPLPQNYQNNNAWLITKNPQPSNENLSLSNNFYMGAVGIAADGAPIFNPLNNRGDDAYLAGELDNLGGHSGRADDYHYHTAPTHLNKVVGNDNPIAFILDGYPLYGYFEPNGMKVDYASLDKNRGHSHDNLGYHYHASKQYPYINQSMYGKVKVSLDKRGGTNFISAQPKTTPLRKSLEPLRGAVITGFTSNKSKTKFSLEYKLKGKIYSLLYSLKNDIWKFTIPNHDGTSRIETYKKQSSSHVIRQNKYVHSHTHKN